MKKFLRDCKGAVTVFVTLLIIPSVLVSGTAVDVARIYNARSAVQNANELALNGALASYDGMLHDLYGLYGFSKTDPRLAKMISDYLLHTIYGKGSSGGGMGTFRSFIAPDYSVNASMEYKNDLGETAMLRQQMLEYMKFRGPYILLTQFLGGASSNPTLQVDDAIAKQKKELDDDLGEIFALYSDLYSCIARVDKCPDGDGNLKWRIDKINELFEKIKESMGKLDKLNKDWRSASETFKPGIEANYYDNVGKINDYATEIQKLTDEADSALLNYSMDLLLIEQIAWKIDSKRESLKTQLDNLEARLNSGECSEELRYAIMEKTDDQGKTTMQRYKEVLTWEVSPLADSYKEKSFVYLEQVHSILEAMKYRDRSGHFMETLTLSQLKHLAFVAGFSIDDTAHMASIFAEEEYDVRWFLPLKNPYDPDHSVTTFIKFRDCSPDHQRFYDDLKSMASGSNSTVVNMKDGGTSSSGNAEQDMRDQINDIEHMTFDDSGTSSGAHYINDPERPTFKTDFDVTALANNVIKLFTDPGGTLKTMGDYALVLTYDLSNFSCYTTCKPGNQPYKTSIAGEEISPLTRYFYQSEWEYLLNGEQDADKNLAVVTGIIAAVRGILNLIASYTAGIVGIEWVVNALRAALPLFGIGFILGEIARWAMAAAETAMDVYRLRLGYKVALYKNNSTWICAPPPNGCFIPPHTIPGNSGDDEGTTFTYENYMLTFLIGKALVRKGEGGLSGIDTATDDLVRRTGDLIEWSMNNRRCNREYGSAWRDEAGMRNGMTLTGIIDDNRRLSDEPRFRLSDSVVNVGITTTVDMRMLFLSLGMAQDYARQRGVTLPGVVPITVTDYRGY